MKVEGKGGESFAKFITEETNFLGGFAFAAIGFEGKPKEEGLDVSLGDDFRKATHGIGG